ncbi:MAG: M28 family metallopeptidase [Candidatus Bathyarchaeia archaeon]
MRALLLQLLALSASVDSSISVEPDDALHSLLDGASIDRVMSHVWSLTRYKTRYALAEECNRSAQLIYGYFSSLDGFNASHHYFRLGGRLNGVNVAAFKRGAARSGEYILLLAHYDSVSNEPYDRAPGADDNACGVAVMMEIAYLMSGRSWDRSLLFIAFSGEELGLIGAEAWVGDHPDILNGVVAGVCLDGVGRGEGIGVMFADHHSKPLADLMVNVSRMLGFDGFYESESILAVRGSDSAAFLGRGLRIVRLWDRDTTYIHTSLDTPDTLNPNRLLETVKVVAAVLYLLSTRPIDELLPETLQAEPINHGEISRFGLIIMLALSASAVWLIPAMKRRINTTSRTGLG